MNTSSHYDVAIIGAGMAGLAAGIRLAHFGKRVCIFERHNVVGGLNSFYSIAGRRYEGRAFARRAPSSTGEARASVTIAMQVDGAWQPAVVGPPMALGDDWQPVSFIATAPAGATSMVFGVQHAGGGAFIVDDVSLVER